MLEQVSGPVPLSLLEKAARVLGAFERAEPRLSLTEVVRRSGIPRSSAHRILDQLVRLRWLEREGRDYRLGLRMLELGALASHHNRLRRAALPLLGALHERTGRPVQLSVLDGPEVVCLERVGAAGGGTPRVGGRLPAYRTAAGRAILAFGEPGTVEQVLRQARPGPCGLRAELAAARRCGVAYERGGGPEGVAAPVRGAERAVAAVSLWTRRGEREHEPVRLAPVVGWCARAVWRELYGVTAGAAGATGVGPGENMLDWLRFNEGL
ncbi:IclR family transcriptional regulator [Streptomyces sp. NPDC048603]|uniref:IclR family transcriptional regulator n=1 Tax=Streptomyces sp. NPDC048603 TaxID=3365577 RepID=UPI003714A318